MLTHSCRRSINQNYRHLVNIPSNNRSHPSRFSTSRLQPSKSAASLGMNADEFRKAAHAAIEEIIQYSSDVANNTLPVLPSIKPGYLAPQLPKSLPSHGQSWQDIQPDISSKIIPGLTNWQSPNFMAFFPATTSYPSILGEMYSSAFSAPAFNWLCSPACTELETTVLDWLADAFHLPSEFRSDSPNGGGGVVQGSASEAVVTVMVAARERYMHRKCDVEGLANPSPERDARIAGLRSKLVALSSDQAHSSTAKGAIIAGTLHRTAETSWEHDLALQPHVLEATIRKCIDDGLEPYYITLSYGTTSTCARDPLHLLGPILQKFPDIWVHVDAAYAGTALICPEYANPSDSAAAHSSSTNGSTTATSQSTLESASIAPLEHPTGQLPHGSSVLRFADSFNTNMHKWLLVNFDASVLYIQRRRDLTAALSISPAYLQNKHTDSGVVTDYRDWQIPLGRRFRALKIWFVVRSYGLEGLRAHIRRTVRVGNRCAELVEGTEQGRELFELVSQPAFGLVCFRLRPGAVPRALMRKGGQVHGLVENGSGHGVGEAEAEATMNGSPFGSVKQQQQQQQEGKTNGKVDGKVDTEAEELANEFSKEVVETINDQCRLFLTSSSTHGKTFIRVVSGNTNASEESVERAFEVIMQTTRALLEKAVSEKK